jgi:hypothetical protein
MPTVSAGQTASVAVTKGQSVRLVSSSPCRLTDPTGLKVWPYHSGSATYGPFVTGNLTIKAGVSAVDYTLLADGETYVPPGNAALPPGGTSGQILAKASDSDGDAEWTNAGEASVGDGDVTNAKLANMAQATFKGRAAGAGTGTPGDLTATQARTILNVADGAQANEVTLTGSETLTNKTLTSPAISGPTLSGTLTGTYTIGGTPTFPSSVATLTGTQTLTNKTLTAPAISSATYSGAQVVTPSAMGALAVNTAEILNTKTLSESSTLTFSATPASNTWFGLMLTSSSGSAITVTIPSSFSVADQGTITSFSLAANGKAYLLWRYTGSVYELLGVPVAAGSIEDGSVTLAKMANLAQDQFIGRVTASTGVPETTTITAAGRALIDDADAAAQRTTLGLVIGTNVQAYDADLATIAGLTATTDNFIQSKSSAWASRTVAQVRTDLQGTGLNTEEVGFRNVPQNSQSAAYTLVAADAGKHVLHPVGDNNARTYTIPANSSVAYPVGTAITFVNKINTVTIAITTDTLTLAGAGTTGSRTLAANGVATALKITSTEWIISGTGLT